MSLNHTRQAVKTFREETDYKKKLASALITMSGNFTEMSQFEEAEAYLDEAIRITSELEDHFLKPSFCITSAFYMRKAANQKKRFRN